MLEVDMGEEGLEVRNLSRDQCAMLADALKSSPDQRFMDDPELRKLFKLLAVLQSDLWDDMTSGRFDFSGYRRQ